MKQKPKNKAAVDLVRKRWDKASKADRLKVGQQLAAARKRNYEARIASERIAGPDEKGWMHPKTAQALESLGQHVEPNLVSKRAKESRK